MPAARRERVNDFADVHMIELSRDRDVRRIELPRDACP